MAKRHRKHRKAHHCKVVSVGGRRRKLCWSKRGRLVSNTKVHR